MYNFFINIGVIIIRNVASGVENEVKGGNRVFYDCTGKPPATIEFE